MEKGEKEDYMENTQVTGGTPVKKKNNVVKWIIYILIGAVAVAVLQIWMIKEQEEEMEKYPAEKVAAYLEEYLGEEVQVSFHYVTDTSTSDYYVPYKAVVILEDGHELSFDVYWEKSKNIDGGLYTAYKTALQEYYADKYELDCDITSESTAIWVKEEDFKGENPPLKKFLNDLQNSNYLLCGEVIESMEFKLDDGRYIAKDMSITKPIDFEEIKKEFGFE